MEAQGVGKGGRVHDTINPLPEEFICEFCGRLLMNIEKYPARVSKTIEIIKEDAFGVPMKEEQTIWLDICCSCYRTKERNHGNN